MIANTLEAFLGFAFLLFAVTVLVVIPVWRWAVKAHNLERITLRIKVLPKQIFSYRKSTWDFEDYPIEVIKRNIKRPEDDDPTQAYAANILNWPIMTERGATANEARNRLKDKFISYAQNNTKLPRPGHKVPLKCASMEHISQYMDMFSDFYDKVLHRYVGWPLITDLSTLNHFAPIDDAGEARFKEEIVNLTKEAYGMDISAHYDEPIYKVMALLKEQSKIS